MIPIHMFVAEANESNQQIYRYVMTPEKLRSNGSLKITKAKMPKA